VGMGRLWRSKSYTTVVHITVQGGGTNLKIGANIFSGRTPPLFGSTSRFDERFRDGQYSLASFLFAVLLLTVAPVSGHL